MHVDNFCSVECVGVQVAPKISMSMQMICSLPQTYTASNVIVLDGFATKAQSTYEIL